MSFDLWLGCFEYSKTRGPSLPYPMPSYSSILVLLEGPRERAEPVNEDKQLYTMLLSPPMYYLEKTGTADEETDLK